MNRTLWELVKRGAEAQIQQLQETIVEADRHLGGEAQARTTRPHWTQRPENAEKVRRLIRRARAARH